MVNFLVLFIYIEYYMKIEKFNVFIVYWLKLCFLDFVFYLIFFCLWYRDILKECVFLWVWRICVLGKYSLCLFLVFDFFFIEDVDIEEKEKIFVVIVK